MQLHFHVYLTVREGLVESRTRTYIKHVFSLEKNCALEVHGIFPYVIV